MKRHIAGLLGLVTILAAAPAFAGVTFTTRDGAINSTGDKVSASAEFTIVPDGIVVKINNLTGDLRNFNQTIQGITFTIYGKRAQGTIDYSRADARQITPAGMSTSPEPEETGWQLVTSGMTYTLRAPSRQNHILPQTDALVYPKGNKTITDAPEANPFLVGPVTIHIQSKNISLTDDIIGVKFSWGDELGGFDAKLTADNGNAAVDTAGAGGGGGGAGGVGGTPGDISLIPPSHSENSELGTQGSLYGAVGGASDSGTGIYGGGDPGGGGGGGSSGTSQRAQQQQGAINPNNPQLPFIPHITLTGQSGPNPKPITADPKPIDDSTPTPDAPPATRITLSDDHDAPNPTPITADPLDSDVLPPLTPPTIGDLSPVNSGGSEEQLGAPGIDAVPEPASLALLALGVPLLMSRRRK